jgi:hypothetical protein
VGSQPGTEITNYLPRTDIIYLRPEGVLPPYRQAGAAAICPLAGVSFDQGRWAHHMGASEGSSWEAWGFQRLQQRRRAPVAGWPCFPRTQCSVKGWRQGGGPKNAPPTHPRAKSTSHKCQSLLVPGNPATVLASLPPHHRKPIPIGWKGNMCSALRGRHRQSCA